MEQLKKKPWQANARAKISTTNASQALQAIIDNADSEAINLCFFIDALDECTTSPTQDQSDLSRLLQNWASKPSVKICLASRDEPALTNRFSIHGRMLELHDLTRSESLVVRHIREELETSGDIDEASRILDLLPSEFREMLDYVVATITQRAKRRHAYLTFVMVKALQGSRKMPLSLLAFSFLDDYLKNPAFALQRDFPFPDTTQARHDVMAKRVRDAKNQLYGWCRGLVELRPGAREEGIDFTHRSV
ncbi:hypothetical protein B0T22DRAFT_519008 [Podospora appendiculata]|uniref:Nephrocystin 3-like N-terminal domain-containing protein n=1 Tax=Podospora appendiculata TaxID=314037 RepID=A0AAE0X2H3_9PEZI|nr:hypothetical protein B0T22DRAFT_519008 [Podospora appendiculata]